MKYRSDFVTNSSSSSFIINYANKEAKEKSFAELRLNYCNYAELIISDVEGGKTTYTHALSIIKEDIIEDAMLYMRSSKRAKSLMRIKGYDNHYDLYNDSDYITMCKEAAEKEIKDITNRLHKRGFFAIVGYDDHGELGFLENELSNMLDGIVYIRNEH